MAKRIVKSNEWLGKTTTQLDFSKLKKPPSVSQYLNKERGKGKYIKGDPESKGKSEAKIEKEIEAFLDTVPHCAWWNTKVKGEPQYIGNGQYVMKASKNKGFADILAAICGLFVVIEVKKCGGYQSPDQIAEEEKVKKRGQGYYFLVTSVRELIEHFTAHKIPWRQPHGAQR